MKFGGWHKNVPMTSKSPLSNKEVSKQNFPKFKIMFVLDKVFFYKKTVWLLDVDLLLEEKDFKGKRLHLLSLWPSPLLPSIPSSWIEEVGTMRTEETRLDYLDLELGYLDLTTAIYYCHFYLVPKQRSEESKFCVC